MIFPVDGHDNYSVICAGAQVDVILENGALGFGEYLWGLRPSASLANNIFLHPVDAVHIVTREPVRVAGEILASI